MISLSTFFSILEGVNLDSQNQMALHTRAGCSHPAPAAGAQTGTMGPTDCSQDAGCTVIDARNNSFGQNFDQIGGGVYAAQFDISGFVEFMSSIAYQLAYQLTFYLVVFCKFSFLLFFSFSS